MLSANKDGNREIIPDPAAEMTAPVPSSGPTETNENQEEEIEMQETPKDDKSNGELDLAIAKYDEVILTQKIATKLAEKYYRKESQNLPKNLAHPERSTKYWPNTQKLTKITKNRSKWRNKIVTRHGEKLAQKWPDMFFLINAELW